MIVLYRTSINYILENNQDLSKAKDGWEVIQERDKSILARLEKERTRTPVYSSTSRTIIYNPLTGKYESTF